MKTVSYKRGLKTAQQMWYTKYDLYDIYPQGQPRPQGLLSYWDGDEKALASAGHLSNLIGCCFSHKLYTIQINDLPVCCCECQITSGCDRSFEIHFFQN